MPHGIVELAAAALLSALLVAILAIRVDPLIEGHPLFSRGDHLEYIAMSESPSAAHTPPYCCRILVPTIARCLPFGRVDSFRALTIFFIWGTGVLIYYVLRRMGQDTFFALIGVVLFHSLNFGTKFVLFDFWLTEPALFFFSALAVLLLIRGNGILLSVTLCLAVLGKESALFLLPLTYTIKARRLLDRRALMYAAAVSLAPVALFILVKGMIPASEAYSPLALFSRFGAARLSTDLAGIIRGGTLGTWGVLVLLLMLFGIGKSADLALRCLPFIVLVYLQPLFAENVDRLLVYGFIMVIPIAVEGFRQLSRKAGLAPWMIMGAAAIPFILVAIKSGYQSPSPEQQLLVLAVWTVLIVLVKRIRKKRMLKHSAERHT